MNRRRFLLSLPPTVLGAISLTNARAAPFPGTSPVPGGVARVPLGTSPEPPRARMGGARLLVVREGAEWIALVGIALSTKPGAKLRVEVERGGGQVATYEVTVARKDYPSEHLKVPPGQVELSAKDLTRYERERVHLAGVTATFSEDAPPSLA